MTATRTLLLPNTAFRAETRMRDAMLIVATSLAIAVAAQVSVHLPFTPVPITGQTLVVCLAGLLLGSRRAAAAVLLYLVEGAAGLPVFADGGAGLVRLTGVTAGYLFAMPLAAALTGWLAERGWDQSPLRAFCAMLAGSLPILATGTLWLGLFTGDLPRAAALGLVPFIPGDIIKATLAAIVFPTLWKFRET